MIKIAYHINDPYNLTLLLIIRENLQKLWNAQLLVGGFLISTPDDWMRDVRLSDFKNLMKQARAKPHRVRNGSYKMATKTIKDVENFWDASPLFTGEVKYDPQNSSLFFSKHDEVYFEDVLLGIDFEDTFYTPLKNDAVLDLGCGIGFWSSFFVRKYGVTDIVSADLSSRSLAMCKDRVPSTKIMKENAEALSLATGTFSFVNCHGVIHHTPDPQACLNEIHRVLHENGRASISVYYDNIILRLSAKAIPIFKFLTKFLLQNKGRGRHFSQASSKDDIVKLYDGEGNPIGKSYSRKEFENMLNMAGFTGIKIRYYFFPFRFFKVKIPLLLSKLIVFLFPFMICANVSK